MNLQNEEIFEALILLLESNVGYGVDLFDLLNLYQLEDDRFDVNRYEIKAGKIFTQKNRFMKMHAKP